MLDSTGTSAVLDTIDFESPATAGVGEPSEIPCDPHLVSLYHRIAPIAAIGAVLVSGVVLLGSLLNIPFMRNFGSEGVGMKVNTAIIFLLLGISLYLTATYKGSLHRRKTLINICIALALATAGTALLEDILGKDLGIDQLLYNEPLGAPETTHPGRMAPLTSTAAIAIGLALLIVQTKGLKFVWWASSACILALIIALSVLLGYGFGDRELYTLANHASAMSLPAGIEVLFLSMGTLCASCDLMLFRRLASSGTGGYMLRRLLPITFACIVTVTAIRLWGQHVGFFQTVAFGAAAVAATLIVCMGVILIWAAAKLDDIDRARTAAEEKVRQLNDLLAAKLTDLEAVNKELEAFSYSVSHDLRTPLRAIDGFSRILWEDYRGQLDGEAERIIQVVRDGTAKMARLIDDILAFSRVGRIEMTATVVDMQDLVKDVLQELQPAIAGRQVHLMTADLPAAVGDRAMLRQVWQNLLGNAVKYTGTHETALIEVGCEATPTTLIYFVRDDGVGFDMRYSDNLFGVFRRLHGTNEFPGTGIGLAIVKRIVVRHGGRVWGRGEPEKGATIYFALPAAKERENGNPQRN